MSIAKAYSEARERYHELGVDADLAIERLVRIPISLQCWQGDDVRGFLKRDVPLGGGLAVTGAYPGAARNGDELRRDMAEAMRLIPGTQRANLHAIYAESDTGVPWDELGAEHFSAWIDWVAERGIGLDFNPTCFGHPLAESGSTLSSPDPGTRDFWIRHCKASRRIGDEFGKRLGKGCVVNLWIPDGSKDSPIDRLKPRERLAEALDEIYGEAWKPSAALDTLESKLFGIGSESYVVGSHEFYWGYAQSRGLSLCFDMGHFHPTESVADKISAASLFFEEFLVHVSRPVRWDSDHIPVFDEPLRELALEIVRQGLERRVRLGLDYFDASVNRVLAWVVGARSLLKALLYALLEPTARLKELELEGDYGARLALLEEARALPFGAVWDMACERQGVPHGAGWIEEAKRYEARELRRRFKPSSRSST
jgi:L-rhamnose isomerase